MRQPSMHTGRPRRAMSPWVAWVATIIVAVVLLVIIAIAAMAEGARIRTEMWELEVLRINVPVREAVYPQSVSSSPTVVAVPQVSGKVSELEVPFASLVMDAVLRSGPGTEYAITGDLVAGESVQLLSLPIAIQEEQWLRVRTTEGQVGWCMVDKLISASAE